MLLLESQQSTECIQKKMTTAETKRKKNCNKPYHACSEASISLPYITQNIVCSILMIIFRKDIQKGRCI